MTSKKRTLNIGTRVTRRQLLKIVPAAGVASWAWAAEPSGAKSDDNAAAWARTVKIGLHQAGWGSRSLRELFTAARELGYDGVELAPPWLEKQHDMEKVYRLLVEVGTELAPAAYVGGHELRNPAAREAYLLKARKNARWIKAHGGRHVTYGTVSGAGARRTATERKVIAEAFDRVADVALSEGCTPLYHNHYVKSCRESNRIMTVLAAEADLEISRAVPSAGEIYRNLTALHEELDGVSWGLAGGTLSVTTEPIVLEGIDLAHFSAELRWSALPGDCA